MITQIEDYFAKGCGRCPRYETAECSAMVWAEGLSTLRAICLEMGLSETVKWGHPCYMHAGRNICIIGAFRGDFRLSFFNAALMKDPEGVLQKQGPNSASKDVLRFCSNGAPHDQDLIIRAYISEAMQYAQAGLLPEKRQQDIELPEELVHALDADPELAEHFAALTPGRQKSYVLNLNGAKASQTRIRRIEKFRDKIIAGKGANER